MYNKLQLLKILQFRDFPGGPVVKTLSTNAGGAGSVLGWGADIRHALWPKNQKHKWYCKKFKTDFKNDPHKTIFKKVYKNCTAQWVWKECIHLWNQHHNQDTLHFRHQKFPHFALQFNPSLPPQSSKEITNLLSVSL